MTNHNRASIQAEIVTLLLAAGCRSEARNLGETARLVEDYGLDSIALVSLIGSVQSKFEIEISPSDYSFEQFETIGSLIDLIAKSADAQQGEGRI
jgi:acyl carrier protein